MSRERSYDLAQLCTELVRKGKDFPTVWNTVLKGNPSLMVSRCRECKGHDLYWRFGSSRLNGSYLMATPRDLVSSSGDGDTSQLVTG